MVFCGAHAGGMLQDVFAQEMAQPREASVSETAKRLSLIQKRHLRNTTTVIKKNKSTSIINLSNIVFIVVKI